MFKQKIKYLVFQGGSVKGVAYIGALEVLEQSIDMKDIRGVAGTSAGAITAALLALGYDIAQVKELQLQFDFKDILDDGEDSYFSTQGKVLNSVAKHVNGSFFSKVPVKPIIPVLAYRMATQFGIYEGDYLREWAENLIQTQVQKITNGKHSGKNLTFAELHQLAQEYPETFRDLSVVGSNLTTKEKVVFGYNNPSTQDVIISDAIRISMSIPQLFKSHCLYYKEGNQRLIDSRRDTWVDGGVYDNYPIDCFDAPEYTEDGSLCLSEDGRRLYNRETLGFRLVSQETKAYYEGHGEKPQTELSSLYQYGKAIAKTRSALQEEKYTHKENVARTVFIDHQNISALEFNLSKEQQDALSQAGRKATREYLACHDVCFKETHGYPVDEERSDSVSHSFN